MIRQGGQKFLPDGDEPAVPTDFAFESLFRSLAHLCEQIGGLMRNERERSQFESDDGLPAHPYTI